MRVTSAVFQEVGKWQSLRAALMMFVNVIRPLLWMALRYAAVVLSLPGADFFFKFLMNLRIVSEVVSSIWVFGGVWRNSLTVALTLLMKSRSMF